MSPFSLRALASLTAGLCALGGEASARQNGPLDYPPAKRVDSVETYHGVEIADPYRWMEQADDPALDDWIAAQTRLTGAYLAGREWDRTHARIAELETYVIRSTPVVEGGRTFFAEWPSIATDQASLYVQEGAAAPRRLAGAPFHYGEEASDRVRFGGMAPSRSGRTLAYSSNADGSRWHRLRFIDVDSGALLEDELRGTNFISWPGAWAADRERFYYIRYDEPADADKLTAPARNARVYAHDLGDSQGEDDLIFDPGDDDAVLYVSASLDGQSVIIHQLDPATQSNRVFIVDDAADAASEPRELFAGRRATYAYLDNDGDAFWFYSTEDAPNGKIVRIDAKTGAEETVIAESAQPISGGSFVGGNALGKFGENFVILYTRDGIPEIRIFNLEGAQRAAAALPAGGSVWGGFVGRADEDHLYFSYLGMFEPRAIYRMDARTGEYALYARSAVDGVDPEDFEIRHVFYESFDGTRAPMFLAYRKGLVHDGSNPAFMYGYGAFGWNSFLFYQSHLIRWMEMGGVYAQPGLRGGGEYGRRWHEAGKGPNKENTIGDFISAAEWLIANGFANAKTLVANGGSASSMPAAAAMMRRPDLFGAGVFDRPALDMLRFSAFTQGRLWLDEFGEPASPEEFAALRAMSPYHNIEPGACYPPTLVMVGETDPVTAPMHGYKYVARMQAAQNCANPALLYLMPDTAHNFGATPEQVVNSRTAMIVFLQKALALD